MNWIDQLEVMVIKSIKQRLPTLVKICMNYWCYPEQRTAWAAGSSFFFHSSVIPSLNWSLRIKWEKVVRQRSRVSNRAPVESVSADWSDHVREHGSSQSWCLLFRTMYPGASCLKQRKIPPLRQMRPEFLIWLGFHLVSDIHHVMWGKLGNWIEKWVSHSLVQDFYGCRWHGALFLEPFVRWKR